MTFLSSFTRLIIAFSTGTFYTVSYMRLLYRGYFPLENQSDSREDAVELNDLKWMGTERGL